MSLNYFSFFIVQLILISFCSNLTTLSRYVSCKVPIIEKFVVSILISSNPNASTIKNGTKEELFA